MTTRQVEADGRSAGAGIPGRRAVFVALMGALLLSAWAVLWLWSQSPYDRYLDHGRWTDAGLVAALCRAVPAGEILVPALLYAAAWVVMIAAMMLPTTFPLLDIFRRVTAARPDAKRLIVLVVAGYLLAWLGFGLLVHGLDLAVHAAARDTPWLIANGWVIGAVLVGTAGMFQFSTLKYRCLDKCRTPFGFVAERWRGASPAREALRIGLDHGAFCVGCCWALMLLMFVVGSGNLGWMLALAAVMATEKNLPGGRSLSTPLGVALLAWAGAIVVGNL
jgi:predicted metal-binding membrane protein